jgi:RNA polymerase sigma factor (sigma-70 family)
VVMTTFFSVQSDTSVVSDLRAWSEEQLIAAAKTGRRAPFGELCERHVKKVFRVIYRIMRNREDAEDAVQECFLSAFVHLKDFDGRSQFVTWLTRIAINAALMKLRKNRGAREVPIDEPNPPCELERHNEIQDDAPDPEETYRLRERREILNTAILRLRLRARNVVELIGLTRILTQRNRTDSGDLDRSSKSADVSRESCLASNAPAAESNRLSTRSIKRHLNGSNNEDRNFAV